MQVVRQIDEVMFIKNNLYRHLVMFTVLPGASCPLFGQAFSLFKTHQLRKDKTMSAPILNHLIIQ
jgi:hypothetical protein